MKNFILSNDEPAEDKQDTGDENYRIALHYPGLQTPEKLARILRSFCRKVYQTVDDSYIKTFPEQFFRTLYNRRDNRTVVHFIDKILIEEKRVYPRELGSRPFRNFFPFQVYPSAKNIPAAAITTETAIRTYSIAETSWYGINIFEFARSKTGSRKCSNRFPPPRLSGIPTNPPTNGEHCENDQWNGHCFRRFMWMEMMFVKSRRAFEGQRHKPEHIERR